MTTIHEMKLKPNPFQLIKEGSKTIEVRLYDEKRQQVKVGDKIKFSELPELTNKITVNVEAILIYKDFLALFADFPAKSFGGEGWTTEALAEVMSQYYSSEEQAKYGVVGIKISREK